MSSGLKEQLRTDFKCICFTPPVHVFSKVSCVWMTEWAGQAESQGHNVSGGPALKPFLVGNISDATKRLKHLKKAKLLKTTSIIKIEQKQRQTATRRIKKTRKRQSQLQ